MKEAKIASLSQKDSVFISGGKMHLLSAVLLIISIFLIYSPSLNGVFTLDDMKIVRKIESIEHIPRAFDFRGITYITFYLNKLIAKPSPFNLRLTNILIHLTNSISIYLLVLMTIAIKNTKGNKNPLEDKYMYASAWIGSFVFALHPLNINAVAYIVQRTASLSALFVLLSLILYIRASTSQEKIKKWSFSFLSGVSIVLGIFSKENAVMGIPLILLYDYVFLSEFNRQRFLRKVIPFTAAGLIVLIIASFSLRFHKTFLDIGSIFLDLNQPLTHRAWMTTDVSWTPIQHILTEFRVVSRYIFLIFIPLSQFMVFDLWGYPVSKGISNPPTTFLAILFIIGVLISSIVKRRRYPFLFFGVAWYFIAISLESFLAVGADLYFEHRNYLPMSGLLAGLSMQVIISFRSVILKKGHILLIVFIVFAISLGIITFRRNFIWQDFLSLWTETVEKAPYNTRAIVTVGKSYFMSSKYNEAEDYLKRSHDYALTKKQSYFYQESALFLGEVYIIQGRFKEAEELIKVFHRRVPASYKLMILKGLYLMHQNKLKKAMAFFNQALNRIEEKHKQVDFLLQIGLADTYRLSGRLKEAEKAYEHILNNHPENSLPYYGLALVHIAQGKKELAMEDINHSMRLYRDYVPAICARAELFLEEGKVDRAIALSKEALSLSQSFYEPYLIMGTVLIYQDKHTDAEEWFKKAKDLWRSAPEYKINHAKAIGYSLKGDKYHTDIYLRKVLVDTNTPAVLKQTIRNRF